MSKVCHGKWKFKVEKIKGLLPEGYTIPKRAPVSLTDGTACVLVEEDGDVKLSIHKIGIGCGIYMSGFEYSPVNARMLLNLILLGTGIETFMYVTDNPNTECAYYPSAKKLVIISVC